MLPWENNQIDAARRAFLDRHPLAKNKEQVALAKGEGALLNAANQITQSVGLVCSREWQQQALNAELGWECSLVLVMCTALCAL